MSILQDYETIRNEIGEVNYQAIEQYLEEHPELFLNNLYYEESEWKKFEQWYNKKCRD